MSLRDLALHLLDIAENSVNANASRVDIIVDEDTQTDRLRLTVIDNGHGMDLATATRALDPFVTTRTTRRVGLGLSFLKEAAEACNGSLTLSSRPACGTRLDAEFQLSHIDRMPLGDLVGTMLALEVGFPSVRWLFTYKSAGHQYQFDDAELKHELGDVSLSEPEVLAYVRTAFQDGIASVRNPVKLSEPAFLTQ